LSREEKMNTERDNLAVNQANHCIPVTLPRYTDLLRIVLKVANGGENCLPLTEIYDVGDQVRQANFSIDDYVEWIRARAAEAQ
jgi:hypothetical protein